MATGGSFSETLKGGHHPFYDFQCSFCEINGKYMEAVRYCEKCFAYMCDSCIRKHKRNRLHKRSELLDQSQFMEVAQSRFVQFPTKRCLKHPDELINIFCDDHDVVCCNSCKALEHSNCANIEYLIVAAKGIHKNKEYQTIKQKTRVFLNDAVRVQDIQDLTVKSTAEDMLRQLESFKGRNECDLFLQVKTAKKFIRDPLHKTQLSCKVNVKEKSDSEVCFINDICQLQDGTILIIDGNNKKLKRLDQSCKLLDSLQVSHEPGNICNVGSDEVAVFLMDKREIQYISVKKKLTLTRSHSTKEYSCRGMVYVDDKLYVACLYTFDPSSYCINVFNNAGQLHHSINGLPTDPFYITVTDDGQHLLLGNYDTDNITMMDLTGKVVNTFSNRNLIGPRGICTDGKGQMFICECGNNTVVQLELKQQKMDVILGEKDGIKNPFAICYDRKQSRLLVSCFQSNQLLVFHLK